MALALIFIGCLLLYAKSKHFPQILPGLSEKIKSHPVVVRLLAFVLFVVSILLLGNSFGFWTGLLIFFMTVMMGLIFSIALLPLNKKYVSIFAVISVLAILIEFIL